MGIDDTEQKQTREHILVKSRWAQKSPENAGILFKDENKMAIMKTKLILHPSLVEDTNFAIQFNN